MITYSLSKHRQTRQTHLSCTSCISCNLHHPHNTICTSSIHLQFSSKLDTPLLEFDPYFDANPKADYLFSRDLARAREIFEAKQVMWYDGWLERELRRWYRLHREAEEARGLWAVGWAASGPGPGTGVVWPVK